MINKVKLTKRAEKALKKTPRPIVRSFEVWLALVIRNGIEKVREIPGYRDECLLGKLKGIRSFRLSLSYRGYYRVLDDGVEFVQVEEVNSHDYKKIERIFG